MIHSFTIIISFIHLCIAKGVAMRIVRTGSFSLLGLVCLIAGCQSPVHDENLRLWAENRELHQQNQQLRAERDSRPDASQLQMMQSEIAQRDSEIQRLQASLREQPVGQPHQPGLEGIDARYDAAAGTVTVELPGDVLFDSGLATLKPGARATLDKIAAAVKRDYRGRPVFVNGHTDSDPINRTRDKWQDNLDLSAARARAVTEYLLSQGLDRNQVHPRAYGPSEPKGSKPASRRVEIVVAVR
jgi:chemotaxis protein MotB